MKLSNIITCLFLVAAITFAASPANAQTTRLKKETMKLVKTLSPEEQEAVALFAGSKLVGKEEGVQINDKKSLKKYFSTLSPANQAEVLEFAKNQTMKEAIAEAPAPAAKPAPATKPANKPAQPAQPVKLTPSNGNMATTPAKPAQPAKPARPSWIEKAESMPATTVKWDEELHDFGTIKQGDVVTHTFTFTNVGNQPLQITRVKASCGCTTPEWSKEAIAPGESGMIKVSFNSRGKSGNQRKAVTIWHNSQPIQKVLQFKGNVVLPTPGTGTGGN